MHEYCGKMLKNLAQQVMKMYKGFPKQISFEDFNQPVGLKMNPENKWVKKAALIPWDEIEHEYAKLFKGFNGQVAKPARLALGALLIQTEYGFSDERTVEEIQENPYLQFFCGLSGYDAFHAPFDPSAMTRFRKRLTAERLMEINEKFINDAQDLEPIEQNKDKDDDDKKNPPTNKGTLIVDATCAPSQIKYPRDHELLSEGREKLERIIDVLHDPQEGRKPRTYRDKARKDYLSLARSKRNGAKKIRKAVGKQLRYIHRDLRIIEGFIGKGKTLPVKYQKQLDVIKDLYAQQKYMYQNHIHSVSNRIVNLRQPFLRPIVRGKAKSPTEFGAKLDISVVNGLVCLEKQSFEAYNESEELETEIEHYRERYACYPTRVLADKIYRNRSNLAYCKERGIRLSGPALGRPKRDAVVDKKAEYKDICDRVEVERAFSLAKRRFSLTQIRTYLKETTQTVIALSILALNLSKLQCVQNINCLLNLLQMLFEGFIYEPDKKVAFIQ